MSDKKPTQQATSQTPSEGVTSKDPERTLLTLDQLSQTIEVMSSVVNRLRAHLGEQIVAAAQANDTTPRAQGDAEPAQHTPKRPSFIVEISGDSGNAMRPEEHEVVKVVH